MKGKILAQGDEYALGDLRKLSRKRIFWVFVLGVALLVLSETLPLNAPWGLSLLNAFGATLVAAAVLGFILSDRDYIQLLRTHIVDALFHPENYRDSSTLLQKWRRVTEYLIQDILPFTPKDAARQIEQHFFDRARDFHFEDAVLTIDISVDENQQLKIIQTTTGRLVVTPHCERPVIEQHIDIPDEDFVELASLEINGQWLDIHQSDILQIDPHNPSKALLRYPIPEEAIRHNGEQRYLYYKRTYHFHQSLKDMPFTSINIERYIKGLYVDARIQMADGSECPYRLSFQRFGLNGKHSPTPGTPIQDGFSRWVLAETGELVLPGESFMWIVLS